MKKKPVVHAMALRALAGFLAIAAAFSPAAWAVEQRVPAHHVRLAGIGGDNALNRKNLLVAHRACTELNTALGKPYQPLQEDEIPEVIRPSTIDIYYFANRTLTITRGALHDIDHTNCALVTIPHEKWTLQSAAGRCDADLLKKTAMGRCDMRAHESAATGNQHRLRTLAGGSPEVKIIAGTACEVYLNTAVQFELCIANPQPSTSRPLAPHPIPAAPLNGGYPGVLLAANTPILTLHAEMVEWNVTVPASMLALPPGIDTNPIGRQR